MRVGRQRPSEILDETGVTLRRARTCKDADDPDREAKLDRIEHVVGHFPDRTFAFDEFGPLQIRPVAEAAWAPQGGPSGSKRTATDESGSAEAALGEAACRRPGLDDEMPAVDAREHGTGDAHGEQGHRSRVVRIR